MAGQTPFSFDTSDYSAINSHINSQLGTASSTNQVSFSYLKLIYPDSSVAFVTDPASFTVPIYKLEGATSFTVSAHLVSNVNGKSRRAEVAQISLTQSAYSPSNVCSCRLSSECNSTTRECTCEQGYSGTYCSFTESELLV